MAVLPFNETQDGQYFGTTVPLLRILGTNLGRLYINIEILPVVIIQSESKCCYLMFYERVKKHGLYFQKQYIICVVSIYILYSFGLLPQ